MQLAKAGFARHPNICGGDLRFAGTRLSLWIVKRAIDQGSTIDECRRMWPVLARYTEASILAGIKQYRDELDANIRENEEAAKC